MPRGSLPAAPRARCGPLFRPTFAAFSLNLLLTASHSFSCHFLLPDRAYPALRWVRFPCFLQSPVLGRSPHGASPSPFLSSCALQSERTLPQHSLVQPVGPLLGLNPSHSWFFETSDSSAYLISSPGLLSEAWHVAFYEMDVKE